MPYGDGCLSMCDCASSPYLYTPHGHVITGKLSMVKNTKLREVLLKGSKYREPQHINWKQTRIEIFEELETYAKKWCKKEEAET
jgi:hypothetical protein